MSGTEKRLSWSSFMNATNNHLLDSGHRSIAQSHLSPEEQNPLPQDPKSNRKVASISNRLPRLIYDRGPFQMRSRTRSAFGILKQPAMFAVQLTTEQLWLSLTSWDTAYGIISTSGKAPRGDI